MKKHQTSGCEVDVQTQSRHLAVPRKPNVSNFLTILDANASLTLNNHDIDHDSAAYNAYLTVFSRQHMDHPRSHPLTPFPRPFRDAYAPSSPVEIPMALSVGVDPGTPRLVECATLTSTCHSHSCHGCLPTSSNPQLCHLKNCHPTRETNLQQPATVQTKAQKRRTPRT